MNASRKYFSPRGDLVADDPAKTATLPKESAPGEMSVGSVVRKVLFLELFYLVFLFRFELFSF